MFENHAMVENWPQANCATHLSALLSRNLKRFTFFLLFKALYGRFGKAVTILKEL